MSETDGKTELNETERNEVRGLRPERSAQTAEPCIKELNPLKFFGLFAIGLTLYRAIISLFKRNHEEDPKGLEDLKKNVGIRNNFGPARRNKRP